MEVVYEFTIGTKIGDIEWFLRRYCPYFALFFSEFGSLFRRGALRKSGWQSHNYGQFLYDYYV